MQMTDRDGCAEICSYIRKRKGRMICINDGAMTDREFEENKRDIIDAFESILPERSGFEVGGK